MRAISAQLRCRPAAGAVLRRRLQRHLRRPGKAQLRRRDLGDDDYAGALGNRAVLAALSGIQSGRGGEPAVDARTSRRSRACAASSAGIQSGNTSDFVARRLLAEGAIAGIKYYPYDGIGVALDDLEAGRIGLVIKLFPVISWLVKDRPQLSVAMQVPTHEKLGIAFAKDNDGLCAAVNRALTHSCAAMANLRACRRAGFRLPGRP